MRSFLDGSINEETVWAGWDVRKMNERVAKLRRREAELGGADGGAAGAAGEEEVARVSALLRRLAASEPRGAEAAAARPMPKELR